MNQIHKINTNIQKATNTTVMTTEEGNKGVDIGVQMPTDANQAIEEFSRAINESAQVAVRVSMGGQKQRSGV